MAVLSERAPASSFRIRGRNFMALVVAPELPASAWFAGLDAQMREAAGVFADRPVIADLSAAVAEGGPEAAPILLEGLEARDLRLVGVDGVSAAALAGTRWERLPRIQGRDLPREAQVEAPPKAASLLIDRPVRSGQSVVFEDGDVTIVGAVGSGAEVIAGGSIHVYGPLRGRAIAGQRAGAAARIFCRRMEAEMVGIDGLYRTPNQDGGSHWGPALHGRPVEVRLDRGALALSQID
ncbi:septum site-determining protein MinC [Phenylobacterium sp.]|uniref:septum site-determining protein MinC n=1 Tax=Phenylobacterium sp. TaxID=1871053 RepID=UPI002810D0EF|nr:septum site-determining protein MinC [Phenylobacterium sp.]